MLHYDLAWNPTRHEQREGRVDRFGQEKPEVRVITYYGTDNPIDGVILDVLIRKHKSIKSDLGVTVAVPGSSEQIAEALFEGALFRETTEQAQQQLTLRFHRRSRTKKQVKTPCRVGQCARPREGQPVAFRPAHAEPGGRCRGAAKRARRHRPQRRCRPLLPRRAAGGQRSGAGEGQGRHRSPQQRNAARLRQASAATNPSPAASTCRLKEGEVYLGRTSPIIEGLAGWTLDQALDPVARDARPVASRCGVVSTSAVSSPHHAPRGALPLSPANRWRRTPRRSSARRSSRSPAPARRMQPQWLTPEEGERLLAARPERNLIATAIEQQIGLLLPALPKLQAALEPVAGERAAAQLAAHERVREAARTKGRVTIEPVLPVDILGAYVLLPKLELTMARRTNEFQTIRSEGGLLPPDLLRRVLDPKEKLAGTRPEDYGLPQGERLNEVITQSWNRLRKHWAEFRAAASEPARRRSGHRPYQRQVEPAAACASWASACCRPAPAPRSAAAPTPSTASSARTRCTSSAAA